MEMNQPRSASFPVVVKWIRGVVKDRFSLHEDKADDDEIECRIREGVELRGATPWILIFAIFVA